jgi:hypothetical protein
LSICRNSLAISLTRVSSARLSYSFGSRV